MWIYPYVDQRQAEDPQTVHLVHHFEGNVNEHSTVELFEVMEIICAYSQLDGFEMSNFLNILSSNGQFNLIQQCLRQFHPTLFHWKNGHGVDHCVPIFAIAQYLQKWIVSYSPGRVPLQ